MPRTFTLTWQVGNAKQTGRWRKKYQGKIYYFSGGRGKTDRVAYDVAVKAWNELKLQLDASAPKPHQAEHENAIYIWEEVLNCCRKNQETEMANMAIAKLAILRRSLSAPNPNPVRVDDTFGGQFELAVRDPDLHALYRKIGDQVEQLSKQPLKLNSDDPFFNRISATSQLIDPTTLNLGLDFVDPLKLERKVWDDRLNVMRRLKVSTDQTLKAYVDKFLILKKALADAGELTESRVYALRTHLTHFLEWLGSETPVIEIKGETFSNYHLQLLQQVEAKQWSRFTAKDYLSSVRAFVRWLWQIEAIPNLPRNIDGKSSALKISSPSPQVVVFEKAEITKLLKAASLRTKLYILLMLNCGMTQKDIADLVMSEVNWDAGRITRKRSKTKGFENVPTVDYLLWPETLRLLRQECSQVETGPVLLNAKGGSLWYLEVQADGKLKKNDNIRNAFNRVQQKTGISKPLKSFKKTSASLIRDNGKYASLEGLFLGHAPQSMSDKHYTTVPQNLFDEAISWLGTEYGIAACPESPNRA